MIYLKHPIHGRKIAIMDLEAQYDEQHGWVRYNPDTPFVAELEVPAFLEPVNQLKRGRPRKAESVGE